MPPARGSRPHGPSDGRGSYRGKQSELRDDNAFPPGLEPRADEPQTPRDVDLRELPRPVKAELRTLSEQQAEVVGAHLLAAAYLVDEDPALAYRHALAARRRAARLPVVRELAAEVAYAAEEWADALAEYRAVRRLTGSDDVLPIIADCERALGRPEEALRVANQATRARLSKEQRVEMRIVEAGARADLGQIAEALRLLKSGIEEFIDAPVVAQARIRVAYAEQLLAHGKTAGAVEWLKTAAAIDPEGLSGAQEQLDELDGDLGFDVFDDETPEDEWDEVEVTTHGADEDGAQSTFPVAEDTTGSPSLPADPAEPAAATAAELPLSPHQCPADEPDTGDEPASSDEAASDGEQPGPSA